MQLSTGRFQAKGEEPLHPTGLRLGFPSTRRLRSHGISAAFVFSHVLL